MPTNLNALIRYKQIDSCLKNNRYGCSIFDLIEACSDALEEFRGTKKRISERTIRDDIRVLRSEMLGFNAPIVFDEGVYLYEDNNFNIFTVPIIELEILKEVYDLLKGKKAELEEKAVESVLLRIQNLLGDTTKEEKNEQSSERLLKIDKNIANKNIELNKYESRFMLHNIDIINNDSDVFLSVPHNKHKNKSLLLWEDIFELI